MVGLVQWKFMNKVFYRDSCSIVTICTKPHPLPQDAKQEDISAHFQTFGEIDNINLKTDPATGRSRSQPATQPQSLGLTPRLLIN